MAVTSIAIAVPEGLSRRAAIEWTVSHLIHILDRMDAEEAAAREGGHNAGPPPPIRPPPALEPPPPVLQPGTLTLLHPPLMGDGDAH